MPHVHLVWRLKNNHQQEQGEGGTANPTNISSAEYRTEFNPSFAIVLCVTELSKSVMEPLSLGYLFHVGSQTTHPLSRHTATKALCVHCSVLLLEYTSVVWDPHQQHLKSILEMVQWRSASCILQDFSPTSSASALVAQLQLENLHLYFSWLISNLTLELCLYRCSITCHSTFRTATDGIYGRTCLIALRISDS